MPGDPELTYTEDIEKKARENLVPEVEAQTGDKTTVEQLTPALEHQVFPNSESNLVQPAKKKESFGNWIEDFYRRWVRDKSGADPSKSFLDKQIEQIEMTTGRKVMPKKKDGSSS